MTDASRSTLVEIHALDFNHPGEKPLFVGLAADIAAGVTFVDGDMGSGKTTFLKLLAGELRGRGRIILSGRVLAADPVADGRDIAAFDPHDPSFDAMTAGELLDDRAARHGGADEAAWARHVAGFALSPHLAKPLFMLSTGSRRKVGLAVALSVSPVLTLLDDPCAGLDTASLAHFSVALGELAHATGRAIVLAGVYGLEAVPGAALLRLAG